MAKAKAKNKALASVSLPRPWGDKSDITLSFEEVSPELAQKWLDENHDNQRKIKKNVVAQYVRQMNNGQWLSDNGETVKFTEEGLSDGQHRLHAVIEHGKPVVLMVMRGLKKEHMTSMDMGSKRTLADILRIHGHEPIKGLSETHLSSLLNSIYIAMDYVKNVKDGVKSTRIDSINKAKPAPLELYDFLLANPQIVDRLERLSEYKIATIAKQAPLSPILIGWFLCDLVDPKAAEAILLTFQDCTPQTKLGRACPSYKLFQYIQKARATKVKIHRFEYPGLFLWALDHMQLGTKPSKVLVQKSHMPGQGHEGSKKITNYMTGLKVHTD